jgi:hypothetical protein
MRLFVVLIGSGLILSIAQPAPANAQRYVCMKCGTNDKLGCYTPNECVAKGGCQINTTCNDKTKKPKR